MTPAGKALLEHARLAIEVVDRAVASARAAGQGKTDLLRVGAYALGIFPTANEVLAEFLERFPHVDIDFHPGHARQSLESLTRRAIDVAIVFAPFEPIAGVAYIPLGSVEPVLVVPSGHRLARLDRIPRPELLMETVFMWRRDLNPLFVDHLRDSVFGDEKHDGLVEFADIMEGLVHVAAGEGIMITNPMVAGLDIANVVFRRLEDPVSEFEYGVAWLESSAVPLVSDFVELIRELTKVAN
jgi:DNA-binding transcriptional LysR family regulator